MTITHEEYLAQRRSNPSHRVKQRRKPAATPTTDPPRSPQLLNRPGSTRGWRGFVVPTALLAKLVEEQHGELAPLNPLDMHANDPELGWRRELGNRVARIRRCKPVAAYRRIYDITHQITTVVRVDLADAICLAFGLHLERDTDIPTLPGSIYAAKQMVETRADDLSLKLTPRELEQEATKLLRISFLIIAYPHNTDRLRKLAPLGCLDSEYR